MKQTPEVSSFRPDWRIFLLPYIIGIVLVPFLGAGIWIIFHYRKRWKNMIYKISDSAVHYQADQMETVIPLSAIQSCETSYPPLSRKFGYGSIIISYLKQNDPTEKTDRPGTAVLQGIHSAEEIALLIENAAFSERERIDMRLEAESGKPAHPTGTLDKKNELVGLWQQGLITEEDFQHEMKQFDS